MDDSDLERLFEHFRAEGDLDALAEVFDRTAPRLLEVARHLARDEARAEDLVQGTFVAAIESARSFDGERELVGWLIGILANLARRARERGARRPDPERLPLQAAGDPLEHAEVAEFAAALERALARVPEAYRDVLRIHLSEEQEPREIAARLDREPGLVRVQLYRGFRHLRRVLPPGFALGGVMVLAPPRGLAAVRDALLDEAAKGGVAMSPASSTGKILGGMLMSKQLGVALIVLLSGAWIWFERGDTEQLRMSSGADTTELAPTAPPTGGERSALVDSPPPQTPRVALEEPSGSGNDDPYGSLSLLVQWADGSPAAGIRLQLHPHGERQSFQAAFHVTTDALGEVTLERLHEGRVSVHFDRSRSREQFDVARSRLNQVLFELPRGADINGQVVDEHGAPVAGARIWTDGGRQLGCAHPVGVSDDAGTFFLRSLDPQSRIFASAPGKGASVWVACRDLAADENDVRTTRLRLGGSSAAAEGLVCDSEGLPIVGARVAVRCSNTQVRSGGVRAPFPATLTDEHGLWRLDGLTAGRAKLFVSAPRFALLQRDVELLEAIDNRIPTRLDRGFLVRGTLTKADGSPCARASVMVGGGLIADELHPVGVITDDAGRYVLENLSAGEVILRATTDSGETAASTRLSGRVAEELTWNVEFGRGATIGGHALDAETGEFLSGWLVRASCRSNPIFELATTQDAGRFTLSGLLDEPYDLTLLSPGQDPRARAYLQGVRPGPREVELLARPEPRPSSYILGRVLDPDGTPLRPTKLSATRRDRRGGSLRDVTWSEGERFRLGPLAAARYRLHLSFGAYPGLVHELELGEGVEHDLGDIQLERPGQVELDLRGPNGEALAEHSTVYLRREGALVVDVLESEDGFLFESGPMHAGSYRLEVTAANLALDHAMSIDVRTGDTTTRKLILAVGHRLIFTLGVPEGRELPNEFRFLIRNEAGELMIDATREPSTQQGVTFLAFIASLPEGRYTYSGSSEDGWATEGSCSVTAESGEWENCAVELFRRP